MSKRLYPHKRVRYWYTYDTDEICTLFADLRLHPQTVRVWIKAELKIIDKGKPALVYGYDLIAFLKKRNDQNKCSTAFDQFYCMKCRDARPLFRNLIAVEQNSNFIKAQGLCRICKTRMFKSYRLDAFPEMQKTFKLVEVSELYDFSTATDNTHLETQEKMPKSESDQGDLF